MPFGVHEELDRPRDACHCSDGPRDRTGPLDQPLDDQLPRHRQDEQGGDEVRSAPLVLLRSVRRIEAAPLEKTGLVPDETSMRPSPVRAAAAHDVGPWIRSPLRRAIPPRRSGESGPAPFPAPPTLPPSALEFPRSLTRAPSGRCPDRTG